MSDIGPISADLPSLAEEIINAPDTISTACHACVESSSSIDELSDKLKILEESIGNGPSAAVQMINEIKTMIESDASLSDIQSKLFN